MAKTYGLWTPRGDHRTARVSLPAVQFRPQETASAHERGLIEPDGKCYAMGRCSIMLAIVPDQGWHLSISHPSRYPTWDEIVHARYELIPDDVLMVMFRPPRGEDVKTMETCFHLQELRGSAAPILVEND